MLILITVSNLTTLAAFATSFAIVFGISFREQRSFLS
jgi:hypothetical protein